MSENFVSYMAGTVPFKRWRIYASRFLLLFCLSTMISVAFDIPASKWLEAGVAAVSVSAFLYWFDRQVSSVSGTDGRQPRTSNHS